MTIIYISIVTLEVKYDFINDCPYLLQEHPRNILIHHRTTGN